MSKKTIVFGYLVLLAILHQDFWLKNDGSLVLGFLPATLAYHMGFVVAAAIGWFFVIKFAWPKGLEGRPDSETASEGGADL
jgi:type IV secretory pathway VirB6-like protein